MMVHIFIQFGVHSFNFCLMLHILLLRVIRCGKNDMWLDLFFIAIT